MAQIPEGANCEVDSILGTRMKTVNLKFPVQGDKVGTSIQSRAHDFLVDAIINQDLDISYQDLLMCDWGVPEFLETCEDEEEGTFFVYGIDLSGDDQAMDKLEQWQDQFKQSLQ